MSESIEEANGILISLRQVAAEVGVSQHSIYFGDESKYHAKRAIYWLGAVIVSILSALVFGLYSFKHYITDLSTLTVTQSMHLIFSKLIIFSVIYFAIVWTSKIYKAHRHNCVVNKHRQNALRTFEAFVKATEDKSIKDAVLIRSTEAIFSPVSTGYLTKEPESPGTTQVLEILRGAMSK